MGSAPRDERSVALGGGVAALLALVLVSATQELSVSPVVKGRAALAALALARREK